MLRKKILSEIKVAMKSGDTVKRDTLRMLDSMIKNVEIEKKKRKTGLSEEEIQEVIARAIKQRKDAINQYSAGDRSDLAQKEKDEIKILSVFAPRLLSEKEIKEIVEKAIVEIGATSSAELGQVMGVVMKRVKNRADGQIVRKIVQEKLK
ncbi:MAG TPA: GatB/YqeY domain-containing protein [Candidatus Portnoybacteria bacterium]|nr:GatB/YqeY domain-containing protein [Candidatus Portnoybacteria bacterium]